MPRRWLSLAPMLLVATVLSLPMLAVLASRMFQLAGNGPLAN